MAGSTLTFDRCSPDERKFALALLYRKVPESLRPPLVATVLDEAERGLIDLSGLWVARRADERVVGALLTQTLAGRAAAVWAPEVVQSWGRGAVAAGLVRAALADLRRRGFRVAQALLDEAAGRREASDLVRGGLPHVTDLIYLERLTAVPLAVPPGLPAFEWRSHGPETAAEFHAVVEATYDDSRDMPELQGVRGLDDVLASHRAGGRFDPSRWWIGRLAGEPDAAAILLLSELPERQSWEVAYLGLTPAARGRGLGRAVLARAVALAAPHTPRLQLAVDARNQPARRLYQAAGFRPFDRRSVHLATLARE